MTGVPASAAGGSSGARRTGPRGPLGRRARTGGAYALGGAAERGATEQGAPERGATEGGVAGRGGKIAAAAVNQASVWNVANLLTMLRLLLVPAFVALMLGNGGYDPAWRSFAWAAFAVAMITDLFDGHLARTYNLVTDFGKIADPIADKAIMGSGAHLSVRAGRPAVVGDGRHPRPGTPGSPCCGSWSSVRRHPRERGGKLKTLTQGIAVGMYVLALTGPWPR